MSEILLIHCFGFADSTDKQFFVVFLKKKLLCRMPLKGMLLEEQYAAHISNYHKNNGKGLMRKASFLSFALF